MTCVLPSSSSIVASTLDLGYRNEKSFRHGLGFGRPPTTAVIPEYENKFLIYMFVIMSYRLFQLLTHYLIESMITIFDSSLERLHIHKSIKPNWLNVPKLDAPSYPIFSMYLEFPQFHRQLSPWPKSVELSCPCAELQTIKLTK